ncbi:hypothetical protein LOZ66_006393 [Ophidiomyces ophidiicola]|nr:hypothetical protein LOZ66_006393 [Ophidiomyces ophidiicola]
MDPSMDVYHCHHNEVDDYTTAPPLAREVVNQSVHIFDSRCGWFICASRKPALEGFRSLSSGFSCEECFLDAAAVCEAVTPEAVFAYDRIIDVRGLKERFRSRCEDRDVIISNHLECQKQEWLGFGERLHCAVGEETAGDWIDFLDDMRGRIELNMKDHPSCWRQVFPSDLLAIADCVGRIHSISHQFPGGGEFKFSATKLKCVRDRYKQELEELDNTIRNLTNRLTTVVRPTLSKFLLHLVVLLMASEYEVVRSMANYENVIAWTEEEWQHQIRRSRRLSKDDYLGLAGVLAEFRLFPDDVELTVDKLKKQHLALMAGLRALVPEFPWEYTHPLDPTFTASMNIMIICVCLRIVPACPADKIENQVDIDYLASQISRSKLHGRITRGEVTSEHHRLIDFLTPEKSLVPETVLAVPGNDIRTMETRLTKRPSHDDIGEDGKRPKVDHH